ncbi:MAG: (d)CMP kinase [Nitrospirae bacterium]|nr:(d)CMP kinase [Fimbriimonadaceae bacterium]
MRKIVIAIDGPAGAGKSTVSKQVAKRLGLTYLDTGAMYRALALKAMRAGLTAEDGEAAAVLGDRTTISFGQGDPQTVYIDGEEVTSQIRLPEVGDFASALSVHSPVRRLLVKRQKEMVAAGGVVLEGRDVTTVVAPDADVRVFLTATLDERARRRCAELQARGTPASYEEVRAQIAERDHRDMTRDDSPLVLAPGVPELFTDGMSVDQVVSAIAAMAPTR